MVDVEAIHMLLGTEDGNNEANKSKRKAQTGEFFHHGSQISKQTIVSSSVHVDGSLRPNSRATFRPVQTNPAPETTVRPHPRCPESVAPLLVRNHPHSCHYLKASLIPAKNLPQCRDEASDPQTSTEPDSASPPSGIPAVGNRRKECTAGAGREAERARGSHWGTDAHELHVCWRQTWQKSFGVRQPSLEACGD
jgi:hypothetical protein